MGSYVVVTFYVVVDWAVVAELPASCTVASKADQGLLVFAVAAVSVKGG